jgi:hypothetical protein
MPRRSRLSRHGRRIAGEYSKAKNRGFWKPAPVMWRIMMATVAGDTLFDFFHNRLRFVDVTNDNLLNIGLWHHLSEFENYVFGVVLQYNRIRSDLKDSDPGEISTTPGQQARLDIYYYILTWDKLKKICEKIKSMVKSLQQGNPSIPRTFHQEFRAWKARIDHLFSAFETNIRNEYEHPSLEHYSVGNMVMWGTIQIDDSGDIRAHVGKRLFAIIKEEHGTRIEALRTALLDLFLKHFSQKPLTEELLNTRTHIEENIDLILKELETLKGEEDTATFDRLLHSLLMYDIYLQQEGVPLSATVRGKFYAILTGSTT